jgi:hypothetical protein
MPNSHEIEIIFDSATNKLKYEHKKNGTVVPAANFGHVDPGDTVIWFSKAEKFAVHFKEDHSPFDSGQPALTAEKTGIVKKTTPLETVRAHPMTTKYRYFVASAKAGGGKHVLTEDPELIVDGTGGGGGGSVAPKPGKEKGTKKK